MEDDGENSSESGAPTKAASAEPEIETAPLLLSFAKDGLKILGSFDTPTAPDPPPESQPVDLSRRRSNQHSKEADYWRRRSRSSSGGRLL